MAGISLNRRLRYFYLRFIRLRGHPQELALGMTFGIFIGLTPTIPFHMVSAVALALLFRASKLTAAAGTFICNPVTVYPIYKYGYQIGSFILGFDNNTGVLRPIAEAINAGEPLHVITSILSGGGMVIGAFLLGGALLGAVFAVPSYFFFFYFFKALNAWRKAKRPTCN